MEHVYAAIRNIIKAMRHVNTPGLDTVLNQAELHLNAADPELHVDSIEVSRGGKRWVIPNKPRKR